MKETCVFIHWAENNFSMVALAYAQRFAYQLSTNELCKDNNEKLLTQHGYVNIEGENVKIELDNSVYYKN